MSYLSLAIGILVGFVLGLIFFSLLSMGQEGDDYKEKLAAKKGGCRRVKNRQAAERKAPVGQRTKKVAIRLVRPAR
jgi:hypothetical protein